MTTVREMFFEDRANGVAALTHELSKVPTGDRVPRGDIAAAIFDLLDTPIGNLVVSAWSKFREVQTACAETDGKPGARQQVRVGRRTMQSIQHPRLEAEIDDESVLSLTFDLVVTLTVDAIVITVADGHVVTVGLGDVSGEATLSWKHVQLARGAAERVVLPHVIHVEHAPTSKNAAEPELLGGFGESWQESCHAN
jgi:hypothetical protein